MKNTLVTSQELINEILEYMGDRRTYFSLKKPYAGETLIRFESNYYLVETPDYYIRESGELVLLSEDDELVLLSEDDEFRVYSIDEKQAKTLFLPLYGYIDRDIYGHKDIDIVEAIYKWNIEWSILNESKVSNSLENINKQLVTSQELVDDIIAYTMEEDFDFSYERYTFIARRLGFRLIEYKCNWYLMEYEDNLIDTLFSKVDRIKYKKKQFYLISENDAKSLYLDSFNEDDKDLIVNRWNDWNKSITSREFINNLITDVTEKISDTLRTYINRDDYFIPYEIIKSFNSEIFQSVFSFVLSKMLEEYSNMIVDINEGLVTSQELIDDLITYLYGDIHDYGDTNDNQSIKDGKLLKYDSNYYIVRGTYSDKIFYKINEDIAKIIYINSEYLYYIEDTEKIIEEWNYWKI